MSRRTAPAFALLLLFCVPRSAPAETGYDAWLRYSPVTEPAVADLYAKLPAAVVRLGDEAALLSAQAEIIRGVRGMLGRTLRASDAPVSTDMILLGTLRSVRSAVPHLELADTLAPDGYQTITAVHNGRNLLVITSPTDRGVLYGAFDLLRRMALRQPLDHLDFSSNPYFNTRWVNEWDNLDGTIERGYAGRSIFFEANNVLPDLTRASDYARLLASLGINGCTVNNVNANPRALTPEFLPQLARLAAAFRPWGVRLSLSVDFSSPKLIGGLDTFDPLDPPVARWWSDKASEIYRAIPDFGGFTLKADSEGRVGPSTYGRTHADAANVLARALQPHGGILVYRGFVYNHHMDWRDLKNDRARAAFDNFQSLDGKFDENAAVQIKHGPIDFQAREPVSPLLGALRHTNEMLELQVTQEYTGQQRHLCYLVPMWKQVLDFDLHVDGRSTPVAAIVSGQSFARPLGGIVGVVNVGRDLNWLGSHLAMANLYGFGRLAWNPALSSSVIASEWTRLTFSNDPLVVDTVTALQLRSWRVYEGYTGPLGLGTLTDILRGHYGPNIESAERNGWGQWIRADHDGIGMDRTVATGTGYVGQYPPAVAKLYEPLDNCPDELLLFMHHVPFRHRLHSGKTVIQHVYDSHYDAAAEAQQFPEWWSTLRGRLDDERFQSVSHMLSYQAGHAVVWRDAICSWFLRLSGIPDERQRAGQFPGRVEAEAMKLEGYSVQAVDPWENASGSKAVGCSRAASCTASYTYSGPAGWHDINVEYFDGNSGISRFELFLGPQLVSSWTAGRLLPAKVPNGDTSVRQQITNVLLQPGDQIRIVGTPDRDDLAWLDYIEIAPR